MVQQGQESLAPQKVGMVGQIIRVFLILMAFAVMTVVAYYIARYGVQKRNEITQRRMLEPYQRRSQNLIVTKENNVRRGYVYNLSFLWGKDENRRIIVDISEPIIWQWFILKAVAILSSPSVRAEIESPENAIQIQGMLEDVISSKKVEDVRFPEGKAKLKREIRDRMNAILDGEKVVAIYFKEFFFQ